MSGGDSTSVASGGSSYPALDATSPTDSVIAGDFGSLSAQEQERQRDEWKAELAKTEEEIITLKQVSFIAILIFFGKKIGFVSLICVGFDEVECYAVKNESVTFLVK